MSRKSSSHPRWKRSAARRRSELHSLSQISRPPSSGSPPGPARRASTPNLSAASTPPRFRAPGPAASRSTSRSAFRSTTLSHTRASSPATSSSRSVSTRPTCACPMAARMTSGSPRRNTKPRSGPSAESTCKSSALGRTGTSGSTNQRRRSRHARVSRRSHRGREDNARFFGANPSGSDEVQECLVSGLIDADHEPHAPPGCGWLKS